MEGLGFQGLRVWVWSLGLWGFVVVRGFGVLEGQGSRVVVQETSVQSGAKLCTPTFLTRNSRRGRAHRHGASTSRVRETLARLKHNLPTYSLHWVFLSRQPSYDEHPATKSKAAKKTVEGGSKLRCILHTLAARFNQGIQSGNKIVSRKSRLLGGSEALMTIVYLYTHPKSRSHKYD